MNKIPEDNFGRQVYRLSMVGLPTMFPIPLLYCFVQPHFSGIPVIPHTFPKKIQIMDAVCQDTHIVRASKDRNNRCLVICHPNHLFGQIVTCRHILC
jgi:hypothetical protein